MSFTEEELAEIAAADADIEATFCSADVRACAAISAELDRLAKYSDIDNDRAKKNEQQRRYYQDHKAEIAEQQRRYREAHKDEIAEYQRRYQEAHKTKQAETP